MLFLNQTVLVIGLAKSGLSAIKVLKEEGAKVDVNDSKSESQLGDLVLEVKPYVEKLILGGHPENIEDYDCVVVSPGVPLDIPFIEAIKEKNIRLIGEIELSYLLCKGSFVGITGTNGKTTTTALTGEMFKNAQRDHFVVGNIGIAAVSKAKLAKEETVMVTELSSFQLESIHEFKAHIAAILNVTPDHLNRHKTMENYAASKSRIFENQDVSDYLILNYDNEITKAFKDKAKSQVVYFSRKHILEAGVFVENDLIRVKLNGNVTDICHVNELFIFGDHNIENALAAVAIGYLSDLSVEVIAHTLKSFKGVEHRIEFVDEIGSRRFYNDSKATNVDSTVCALKSMPRPTILIAGGMDKGGTYNEMFNAFNNQVKALVLLGETKHIIMKTALELGFTANYLVNDMDEAVIKAFELSEPEDIVLLSPACASWDMYENFEKRGEHFKSCVAQLKNER